MALVRAEGFIPAMFPIGNIFAGKEAKAV